MVALGDVLEEREGLGFAMAVLVGGLNDPICAGGGAGWRVVDAKKRKRREKQTKQNELRRAGPL